MILDTKKEMFCVNQIIGQKTEILMIEGDSIIPDVKPDILNAIQTNGNVFIAKKEILDGRIKLEGNMEIYIVYIADDEKNSIRSLIAPVSFSEIMEFDKCKESDKVNEEIKIKNIECRVLNGRKISIKATLETELTCYSNDNIEIIENINNIEDVQFLRNSLEINSYIGEGNNKVYAKDTIKLDNIDFLAEVLKVDVGIINKDIKISYNKILTKADAEVRIMYLTEDDRISSVKALIPVIGFVDIQSVNTENVIDLRYKIKNISIKPNVAEEQSIYVEIEMDLNVVAYENKTINVIQDLYSPTQNLKFNQKRITACTGRSFIKDMCSVKERIENNELSGSNIYDLKVTSNVNNKTILNDNVIIEGDIEVNILFSRESTKSLVTHLVRIPYTHEINAPGITTDSNIQIELNVEGKDLVILPEGNSDLKIDMSIGLDISKSAVINIIDEIEDEEEKQVSPYNMTIYFVKKLDTLWDIAKKFGSTIDNIMELNEIDNPNGIYEGQQLFIPKYQKKVSAMTA